MSTEQKIELIKKEELKYKASYFKDANFRLVQISATALTDKYELTYCFEKEYIMEIIRVTLDMNDNAVSSISEVFFPACLYENEIHDLFGINFPGLVIDFKGNFYQTAVKTPYSIIRKEASGAKE